MIDTGPDVMVVPESDYDVTKYGALLSPEMSLTALDKELSTSMEHFQKI